MAHFKLPRWFHQLGSPKWFYQFAGLLQPWLALISLVLLFWGIMWGLLYAPADYQQGNSFRIIYVHVPTAILSQSIFMMLAVAGAIGLIWKIKMAFIVARACVPIGASMTVIALLTGAIWGKPTWGTFWQWDARLTSTLVLLFLYLGILALYQAISDRQIAARATAILSLVGLVNLPVIKYSVDWWHTIHQPATFTLTQKPNMPAEMYLPLIVMVSGIYALFVLLLLLRTRNEILAQEGRSGWLTKLLQEGHA